MVTALDIQAAIEDRLAAFEDVAYSLSSEQGAPRLDVRSRYWVAYEGSGYEQPFDPQSFNFTQDRIVRFSHYVEVLNLQRDYQGALGLHEDLMTVLNGFRPNLPDLKSPLLLEADTLINQAGINDEPRYRYRAQYQIVAIAIGNRDGDDFQLQRLNTGLWRSPVGEVGEKNVSTLDAALAFETEGEL